MSRIDESALVQQRSMGCIKHRVVRTIAGALPVAIGEQQAGGRQGAFCLGEIVGGTRQAGALTSNVVNERGVAEVFGVHPFILPEGDGFDHDSGIEEYIEGNIGHP